MNTRRMQCIGEHLRKERRVRNKTLERVADAVGLKKNTISAYEKGKISIPIDNLDAVCRYLGIDSAHLRHVYENRIIMRFFSSLVNKWSTFYLYRMPEK